MGIKKNLEKIALYSEDMSPMVKAIYFAENAKIKNKDDLRSYTKNAKIKVVIDDQYLHKLEVSGVSKMVNGRPSIMIDDTKHPSHQDFTLMHELSHCKFDLQNANVDDEQCETNADSYATFLAVMTSENGNVDDMIKHNPEMAVAIEKFRDNYNTLQKIPFVRLLEKSFHIPIIGYVINSIVWYVGKLTAKYLER